MGQNWKQQYQQDGDISYGTMQQDFQDTTPQKQPKDYPETER